MSTPDESIPEQAPRIVVIDDSPTVCTLLRISLERAGFVVATYTNPLQAARDLLTPDARPPALAIIDLQMPLMSGYILIQHLRKKMPALPMIILSADSGMGEYLKGRLAGAKHYLSKPFDPDTLITLVRQETGFSGLPSQDEP